MSRHHFDVATPKGDKRCRDITLRSRRGLLYEETREVFASKRSHDMLYRSRHENRNWSLDKKNDVATPHSGRNPKKSSEEEKDVATSL